ncbi:hypothetical protein KOI35_17750 [Actinoplanes bogorensis]|uniref:Uncharacterized protein n=1 Tax=Paractinoplanes bogorensis TaxID=1610840 RepID=A0ABS5YPH1_9ACTN|nr:hypothetical protein [Actinoplanes bogorensis]MBU2665353.1 hypothetical protein [Actinoplanes bogorensis]
MMARVVRPTEEWRESIAEEAELVAQGDLDAEFAVTAELYPPDLLQRLDEVFDELETRASQLDGRPDDDVLLLIQETVLQLNAINDGYEQDAIATEGRTRLCSYIDQTLTAANIDLDALSARHNVARSDLTDEWRTW